MPDDDDNNDDTDGTSLWHYVTRDVKPLQKEGRPPQKVKKPSRRRRTDPVPAENLPPVTKDKAAPGRSRELDKRTQKRVRRGELTIEGTLDLHGLTQEQAHERLRRFVLEAYERGQRYLLVITGKGKGVQPDAMLWYDSAPGVLKQRVPEWLDAPPLREIILQYYPAQKQHGGEGALYVYLRRRR